MEESTQQGGLISPQIRERFDQVLESHMERLLGTKYGIGGLPLNLTTISCLVLLAEQDAKGTDADSASTERFTQEMLLKELADIGLDPNSDLKESIEDLFDRGYISIDGTWEISVKKPTLSIAQLFDRLFPGMPGTHLVAYIMQTIDEAESGRKDPESAISQFDQTLGMQGVPLRDQKEEQEEEIIPSPPRSQKKPPRVTIPLKYESTRTDSGPRVLSTDKKYDTSNVKEIAFGQAQREEREAPESAPDPQETIEPAEPTVSNVREALSDTPADAESTREGETPPPAEEGGAEDTIPDAMPPVPEEHHPLSTPLDGQADPELEKKQESRTEGGVEQEYRPVWHEPEGSGEEVSEETAPDGTDEHVEESIAAFEHDLAMQCPICGAARVQETLTSKGKVYYRCQDDNCHFISWGKPHHLACPQCSNPFLVETPEKTGQTVLRCPRATCRYVRKLSGETAGGHEVEDAQGVGSSSKKRAASKRPRRRVKKRRVVRRKR